MVLLDRGNDMDRDILHPFQGLAYNDLDFCDTAHRAILIPSP